MRTVFLILGFASLASFSALADCVLTPVPVTSSLVMNCDTNIFDFGHDLNHNPANPLPSGGSLILKSLSAQALGDGYIEWDLNFGFTSPSVRKTVLDFSVFGENGNALDNGFGLFALGRSASPFNGGPPNETGSNFLITETVTVRFGDNARLSVCGGSGFPLCDPSIVNAGDYSFPQGGERAAQVSTTIIDNAGDLTGFDEAFQTPEPASWMLAFAGLLSIGAMRLWRQ